mgnify:CR=1 FL=1
MADTIESEIYVSPFDSIDLINPLELLSKWVDEAKELGLPEPDAMNLATVDKDGNPHNRMVLMGTLMIQKSAFSPISKVARQMISSMEVEPPQRCGGLN